jgi:uncharacterized protein (TIGR00369 family)
MSHSQAEWLAVIKQFFEQQIAFDRYLGLKVEEVQPGQARLRLPYRPEFLGDPFRPALHGGVISTLVDVAAGVAATSTLPFGSKCSTVDLRVDYLLPGRPADLWAEAVILRGGRSVAVVNVEVTQQHDSELLKIATGRAVYSLKPASGGDRSQ